MSAHDVQELVARAPRFELSRPVADPLAALTRWVVTDEQVATMQATEIIWRGLIARSHVSVWAAPANGGKTTVARFAAAELSDDGYRVLYFQEDASAGDLPMLHEHAKASGYALLNSTLAGTSAEEQLDVLREMARQETCLDSVVMFFDTLKKYGDLMSKRGTREFFMLMRSLTLRGATIILLGHTNKHLGLDGKPVFEGVGDIRNDVDELFYLEALPKDADGRVVVTIRPDKTRCAVHEASFDIDTRDMSVTPREQPVDVRALRQQQEHLEQDRWLIDAINAALGNGGMNHTDLVTKVRAEMSATRSQVEAVVRRYTSSTAGTPGALWSETRLPQMNARRIALMPAGFPGKSSPSGKPGNPETDR